MRTFFLIAFAFLFTDAVAQRMALPAPNGVYLKLGTEFPTTFSYLIQRKAAADKEWKLLAQNTFPNSSATLKARLMTAHPLLRQGFAISDTLVKVLWRRAEGAIYTDSIKPYDEIPYYASALGIGYLDTTAVPGEYQYQILLRNSEEKNVDSTILKVSYRPQKLNARLAPIAFEAADESVAITYRYLGEQKPGGIKVLRSRFGYNQFEQIPAFVMFASAKDSTVTITDQTAAYKMAYQYIAVPYDGLGNEGIPSDTLYVYNNAKAQDIGFFQSVNAAAVDKAIKLRWKLENAGDVKVIKIFKSLTWDGNYVPVGTAAALDSTFTDINVKPMVTYYYRLQAQGPYSSSLGSTRVHALMSSPRKVVFPPQRLVTAVSGNVVTLTFKKVDRDARGYYVYRRDGYNGKQIQLPRLLLSTDTILTYIDTVANLNATAIYSYSAATVNSSYEISPQSESVTVYMNGRIPIPTKVATRLISQQAMVLWNDMSKENPIAGYVVYRSEKKENEKVYGKMHKIAELPLTQNSFVDSTIVEGNHYGYYIQSKGIGTDDALSSLSAIATVHYNSIKLLPPANVIALAQSNGIKLSWTNPLGIPLTKLRIYRAKVNEELSLLKEINADVNEFLDSDPASATTYFYAITAIDARGKESAKTTPIGLRFK